MSVSIGTKIMEVLFNVQGYYAKDIHFSNDNKKIIIEVEQIFESRCSRCGLSGNSYHYDTSYRMIYIGSILCRSVYARVKIYRFDCPNCGVLTEQQSISNGKSRYSKSIGKVIIQYTKLLDNVSTSKLLGISVSTVYRSNKKELSRLMEVYLEKVSQVHKACVDEVAYHAEGRSFGQYRTYCRKARGVYLDFCKKKRRSKRVIRYARKQMLQYVCRNIKQMEDVIQRVKSIVEQVKDVMIERLDVAKRIYKQQLEMYKKRTHRVKDRIVSFHRSYVRPIKRGKNGKKVEFGPKAALTAC